MLHLPSSGVCRLLTCLLYKLESHMDTSEDSTFLQDMLMGNTLHLLIKVRLYFSSHQYMNEFVLAHFSDPTLSVSLELGCIYRYMLSSGLTIANIDSFTHLFMHPFIHPLSHSVTLAFHHDEICWNLPKHWIERTPSIIICWQTGLMNPAHAVCYAERGWWGGGVASREGKEVEGEEEIVIKGRTTLSWTSGRPFCLMRHV